MAFAYFAPIKGTNWKDWKDGKRREKSWNRVCAANPKPEAEDPVDRLNLPESGALASWIPFRTGFSNRHYYFNTEFERCVHNAIGVGF
jgi:hypothetical protein